MSAARIDRILGFEHGLPPAYAVMVALVGLVFLVFGWRLHRLTLAACGFVLGAFAGALLAKWIGIEQGWGRLYTHRSVQGETAFVVPTKSPSE